MLALGVGQLSFVSFILCGPWMFWILWQCIQSLVRYSSQDLSVEVTNKPRRQRCLKLRITRHISIFWWLVEMQKVAELQNGAKRTMPSTKSDARFRAQCDDTYSTGIYLEQDSESLSKPESGFYVLISKYYYKNVFYNRWRCLVFQDFKDFRVKQNTACWEFTIKISSTPFYTALYKWSSVFLTPPPLPWG